MSAAQGQSGRGRRITKKNSFRVQLGAERVPARRVGPGSIVGAAEVLLGTAHTTSAISATGGSAARLTINGVRTLMRESTVFTLAAWRSAAAHVAHAFLDSFATSRRLDIEQALGLATVIVPWGDSHSDGGTGAASGE